MPNKNDPAYKQQRDAANAEFAAWLDGERAAGRKVPPGEMFHKHAEFTKARGVYQGKSLGQVLGKVVKTAAPIAALAIPGVGPLAAAGIAAGGRVAGRALEGESFDPLDAAKYGVTGAAGNAALGGQGYKAFTGGGGGGVASAADVASGGGGQVPGGGGGVLGKLGDWVTDDPLRAAQLGLGAVNAVQGQQAANQANKYRAAALSRIAQPPREDLSSIFADQGPYSGGGSGTAKRAAVRALAGRS